MADLLPILDHATVGCWTLDDLDVDSTLVSVDMGGTPKLHAPLRDDPEARWDRIYPADDIAERVVGVAKMDGRWWWVAR